VIITLQNQKGGVGKTTLSLHLAHYFTTSGARVLVVDADPQGSARDWLQARDTPAPFTLVGLDRPTVHRDIANLLRDYDVVVIDAPPRVTDIARSAILAADLVIIPVQPSPLDVWAAQDTVRLVNDAIVYKEALRSVFAINREIVNTAIGRDVSSALGETQVPVLSSHIAQRVAFAESLANGQTVFETKTDAKAVAEIRALGAEILALFELDRSEPFRRPA
jgi:chromosome partitioning protein